MSQMISASVAVLLSVCGFLLTEPIFYLVCLLILCAVCKLCRDLFNIGF